MDGQTFNLTSKCLISVCHCLLHVFTFLKREPSKSLSVWTKQAMTLIHNHIHEHIHDNIHDNYDHTQNHSYDHTHDHTQPHSWAHLTKFTTTLRIMHGHISDHMQAVLMAILITPFMTTHDQNFVITYMTTLTLMTTHMTVFMNTFMIILSVFQTPANDPRMESRSALQDSALYSESGNQMEAWQCPQFQIWAPSTEPRTFHLFLFCPTWKKYGFNEFLSLSFKIY